jgi:ABC-type protease/lipase transport system fused ATPase/permease subunit
VIFMFEPSLGVFALCGTAVLVRWPYQRACHPRPLAEANTMAIVSGQLATNNLRNAEVIESMGMLPNLMERWFKLHARSCTCRHRPARRPASSALPPSSSKPRCNRWCWALAHCWCWR